MSNLKFTLILGNDLKVKKYRNGNSIPLAKSNEQWEEFGQKCIGAYSINEEGNYLYNWYAVNDKRGLAPEGWKIPSNTEWNEVKVRKELLQNPTYAGYRCDDGNYFDIGNHGCFWSSIEIFNLYAWTQTISCDEKKVFPCRFNKRFGFSVRCVKEGEKKIKRCCSKCGEKMNSGYIKEFTDKYFCSKLCLFTDGYTQKEFNLDFTNGDIYWTVWEEE